MKRTIRRHWLVGLGIVAACAIIVIAVTLTTGATGNRSAGSANHTSSTAPATIIQYLPDTFIAPQHDIALAAQLSCDEQGVSDVKAIGLTPTGDYRLEISSSDAGYTTTTTGQSDKNGIADLALTCHGFTLGTYTFKVTDLTRNTWASVQFTSIPNGK